MVGFTFELILMGFSLGVVAVVFDSKFTFIPLRVFGCFSGGVLCLDPCVFGWVWFVGLLGVACAL